jgi:hypothetical protein
VYVNETVVKRLRLGRKNKNEMEFKNMFCSESQRYSSMRFEE